MIANQVRTGELTLTPGERKRVPFRGSYIAIFTNDTARDVLVSIDSGITTPVKAGTGFPTVKLSEDKTTHIPATFQYVDFINPADTDMTVEYILSLGELNDTRSVITGSLQVDLSAPYLETIEPLTVQVDEVSILAANALVKERCIQNTGVNPVWYGDDSVDPATGRGNVLYPQGSAIVNAWGAIYFKAEYGETRVSINEVRKEF